MAELDVIHYGMFEDDPPLIMAATRGSSPFFAYTEPPQGLREQIQAYSGGLFLMHIDTFPEEPSAVLDLAALSTSEEGVRSFWAHH
jgi:hypothetical protein